MSSSAVFLFYIKANVFDRKASLAEKSTNTLIPVSQGEESIQNVHNLADPPRQREALRTEEIPKSASFNGAASKLKYDRSDLGY